MIITIKKANSDNKIKKSTVIDLDLIQVDKHVT